jgi:MerR family transcriptional regulator, redox-sensitive transcriptional activator SoxR
VVYLAVGQPDPNRQDWARLSAAWCHDLDERISRLQDLRHRLTGCIGCGCLSMTSCRLANPVHVLGRDGAGPRNLCSDPPGPP